MKGVKKHGQGSWAEILSDTELRFFATRSSTDLKDKWKNLEKSGRIDEYR